MILSVFAGHSGGHLFPAFAFAEAFRDQYPESKIHLVTSKRGETIAAQLPSGIIDEVIYFPEFPFPSGWTKQSLHFLWRFPQAFILASRYLSRTRPDLCAGFGSYISYPGMLLASARNIPTLIHEQNLVPGKATAWLAQHVDCVAVSFDTTFSATRLKKREVTGLPLRSDLVCQSKEGAAALNENEFRIVVIGGSQGSHRINEVVLETFSQMSPEEKKKIAVTHITGQADFDKVTQAYQKSEVAFQTFPFVKNMGELYRRASFAITRAGANTLFELALFKIPALVVPYPHAAAHQTENARFFGSRQALLVKEESELTAAWLREQITDLIRNPEKRELLSNRLDSLASPNAAKQLLEAADKLMKREDTWVLQNQT